MYSIKVYYLLYYITSKIKTYILLKINYVKKFDLNLSFLKLLSRLQRDNLKTLEFFKSNPNASIKDYYITINKKKALIYIIKRNIKYNLYKKFPKFYYNILISFKIVNEENFNLDKNNSDCTVTLKKTLFQKSTLGVTKEMINKKESILNEKYKKTFIIIITKNIIRNFYNSFQNKFKNIKAFIYGSNTYYKKKDLFVNHELERNIWEENRLYLKNYHKAEKQDFWFYFKLVFLFIFYTSFLFIALAKLFFYKDTLLLNNTTFLNYMVVSFYFLILGIIINSFLFIIYDLPHIIIIKLKFLSNFNFIELRKDLKNYIFIDSYFIRTLFLNLRVIILFFILFYTHYLLIGQNDLSITITLNINYLFNYIYFFLEELFSSAGFVEYFNDSTLTRFRLYIINITSILLFIKKGIIASLLMTTRLCCFFLSIY